MGHPLRFLLCDHALMLTQLSDQIADIVSNVSASVVQVHGHRRPASGLVYAHEVVATTMGAIDAENGIHVTQQDGRTLDAELIGWDPSTKIAVLRVSGLDARPVRPSETAVRVGQLAVAVARSWSNAITASAGVVAVIGGPLHTGRRRTIDQVFRTTAPMHEGFAGGAFLDVTGGLTGVVTAASIRGFRVVIPAAIAWKAAAALLEHGHIKRGYLGIAGQSVALPEHQHGSAGRTRGLLIMAVTSGGPAAQAGVFVGDVLLAVDQKPVDSLEELMDLMQATGAGQRVALTLLRGGASLDVSVTAGNRPGR